MTHLSKDMYAVLVNAVDIISNFCTDFTINNGVVRQLSDDRIIMLEMILDNSLPNFRLVNSKQKLKMFNLFKDEDQIVFTVNNNVVEFGDNRTIIKFVQPAEDVMISTFIDDNKFKEMIDISQFTGLTTIQLDDNILNKIRTITDVFNTRQILFHNNKLHIRSDDKAQSADILPIDNLNVSLVTVKDCFVIYDNVNVHIYSQDNNYYAMLDGLANNINVKMYLRLNISDD